MTDYAKSRTNYSSHLVPCYGQVFPDGRILDLVKMPKSEKPELLLWNQTRPPTIATRIAANGHTYAPPDLQPSQLAAVRLPPAPRSYGDVTKLFTSVQEILRSYGGLRGDYLPLATYFSIATHFTEVLPTAPFLLIAGDGDEPAAQLLRTLSLVCRRAILASAITLAAQSEILTLAPTFLLHQPDLEAGTARFIRSTQHQGFNLLEGTRVSNGSAFSKAVYAGEDAGKLPTTYVIPVTSLGEQKRLNDHDAERIATKLQSWLLHYRLTHLRHVSTSTFDVPEFARPIRDTAAILGRCIVGDGPLQSDIRRVLAAQDEQARAARTTSAESVVTEVLLAMCHGPIDKRIRVMDLTERANVILLGRREGFKFFPREVGTAVKMLGIVTKRDSKGFGFLLTTHTRQLIHDRARALTVPSSAQPVAGCRYCQSVTTASEGDERSEDDVLNSEILDASKRPS